MKKGEKRKQELLKIAYELFLSRGYENTSVDEIIAKAQIAKGTYYYYFPSKEQMLEDIIAMMIESEAEAAKQILAADLPVPQKIIGIKIRKKLIEVLIPLLSEAVTEGVKEGLFACDNIPERVRMLLALSNDTFNERAFTERDISVFIDVTEKLLGAEQGTMSFITGLIDKSEMEKTDEQR